MRLFVILLLIISPLVVFGQLHGTVVSIADGDTFTLLTSENRQIRIRLYGIDAPEKAQDFGAKAKKALSDLVFQKDVRVVEKDVDRYGRTVGIVTIGSVNVNESLLNAGLAWHYKRYDTNPTWASLEDKARAAKVGIWSMPDPIEPWTFRRKKS